MAGTEKGAQARSAARKKIAQEKAAADKKIVAARTKKRLDAKKPVKKK